MCNRLRNLNRAFIVFTPTTYPNFNRFVELHPNLRVQSANMSFSVTRDDGSFEWASSSLRALFCQPSRILDPDMWRMFYDIFRFNVCARRLVADGMPDDGLLSIGEYLKQENYSESFINNFLLVSYAPCLTSRASVLCVDALVTQPLTGAIWSTPLDKCELGFPARTLVRLLRVHIRYSHSYPPMSRSALFIITVPLSCMVIQGGSHSKEAGLSHSFTAPHGYARSTQVVQHISRLLWKEYQNKGAISQRLSTRYVRHRKARSSS
jgi:predicted NAD/FAD-binding protein